MEGVLLANLKCNNKITNQEYNETRIPCIMTEEVHMFTQTPRTIEADLCPDEYKKCRIEE